LGGKYPRVVDDVTACLTQMVGIQQLLPLFPAVSGQVGSRQRYRDTGITVRPDTTLHTAPSEESLRSTVVIENTLLLNMMCQISSSLAIFVWLFIVVSDAFSPAGIVKHDSQMRSSQLRMAKSVIVVSPPGGVGEVAAVKAACMGNIVRWFVVSKGAGSSVTLSPDVFKQINEASGSLMLAGSTIEDLKIGSDAVAAVSKWCSSADGIICSYDGCNADEELRAAILLATSQAVNGVEGTRVAILGADEDLDDVTIGKSDGGINKLVGSLFGDGATGPTTMSEALGAKRCIVRHGELFGTPESSPDFSPLEGGPRRDPTIAEEYTMRNVRVDPFLVSGNIMASASRRTCRHAVGEVAALLATGSLKVLSDDISISSQPGTEEWTLDQWEDEFDRVRELISSGKATTLFSQELIVDNTERLADWLGMKWAPAVMRTYDIAAIRIGARPVYANRIDDSKVEIVWQELVNFETRIVGKMLLEVTKNGIVATREAGDRFKGYGSISKRPLPGEDVLVRRLADAASQSIEKGLAQKVRTITTYSFLRLWKI
jgi:hypothetical protein